MRYVMKFMNSTNESMENILARFEAPNNEYQGGNNAA